jgi:predicted metal-dependent enzyme (double-stranded beta helix superfamily)
MGKYLHTLKTLREIALEHGAAEQPDLALMARELGMAWPPNHMTPVHDHAGLWGLEVTLLGALEVQSYQRDPDSGDLRELGRDWLGPGDGTWFEGGDNHAHRCRNLSQRDTALTLHVYGGDLAQYFAYEKAEPQSGWVAKLQRAAVTGSIS